MVRAASKERVDGGLKLHGHKATARLVADAKAESSDPSHVVSLKSASDVEKELVGWVRAACARV